ncbi:MAG: ATP-binding protein [Anaerolineales bacterium]|nr:ATP-binding protein [Anaerolineales bacterium]
MAQLLRGLSWEHIKGRLDARLSAPDERERERQTRLLNTILRASLTATGVALVIPIFLTRPIPVPTLGVITIAFLMQLGTFYLVRTGRPQIAGLLLSLVGWVLITATAYIFGGLDDPSYNAYIIVVLISGLLLGGRAATAFAALSILTGLGLLLAGNAGMLPVPERVVTPAQRWATGTLILFLSAVLLRLAMGSLARALEEARRNERAQMKANRELQEIRASLEQRVQARTQELQESHSELEAAYRALKENHQQLLIAEKMASLGRLTAGIAHEMNTPLAAVRAALNQVEMLAEEYRASADDPEVEADDHREIAEEMLGALEVAQSAAEKTQGFVRGVKAQTRDVEAVQAERFSVAEVIQDTVTLLSHALRHAQCEARLHLPEERIELVGPPGRLSQVMTNLITNAIDASPPDSESPIDVYLDRVNDSVRIRVQDQGCGISDRDLGRVFDPMFTTKPFGEGTGLGLTIVHDIVQGDFGGSIEVDSAPGEGTTFTVVLPERKEGRHAA